MPFLFQRRFGTEDRPLTRSYIRECLVATSQAAQITAAGQPLEWRPHDFRRIFVTDAIRSGLPPYIAAEVCGHSTMDTTMGYAAIYPEDVIAHHRAFIARRRAERPNEEYRDLTAQEWDDFLAHFELRKWPSEHAAATTEPLARTKTPASLNKAQLARRCRRDRGSPRVARPDPSPRRTHRGDLRNAGRCRLRRRRRRTRESPCWRV